MESSEKETYTSATSRTSHKRDAIDELDSEWAPPPAKRPCTATVSVVVPGLAYPRSMYEGTDRRQSTTEREALQDLMRQYRAARPAFATPGAEDFTTITLDDFTFYRQNEGLHPNVCRPLSDLLTRGGDNTYLFDGTISIGNIQHKVYGVPFSILSLDGYGTDAVTISDKIWVQSPLAEKHNAWYLLKRPSQDYARFHIPFLWLADFSKHFVAYLDSKKDSRAVRLHDFKHDFYNWLIAQHGGDNSFAAWYRMFGSKDFRTVIAANYEFLWKESVTVQDDHRRCFLWREVNAKALSAVPEQPQKVRNTIVTPYVYECFKNMYFASAMECRKPVEEVHRAALRRTRAFETNANMSQVLPAVEKTRTNNVASSTGPLHIAAGDVVQLARDSGSAWKDNAESWYAYVQAVEVHKRQEVLRVIWLYRPEDTPCAKMHYPYRKELFFSDHCNCGSVNIPVSEVVQKVNVKFDRTEIANDKYDFFVRQSYITDEDDPRYASFVTFQEKHTRCGCEDDIDEAPTYKEGETVLVSGLTSGRLEPVILLDASHSTRVRIRKLRRRGRDFGDSEAKANELVYTEETALIDIEQVKRRCNVRVYTRDQVRDREVPAPYSYNGTGDCWILTGQLVEGRLQDIAHSTPLHIQQGFDPQADTGRDPLQGLSLFCGGGSFDRGFEESGAVKFTHSVDWAEKAIHTCRANSTDPDKLKLFHGNVNDFIARALAADASSLIPEVGSIRFMTAGSPCVAFSLLQPDQMSESSLRNASLVAALATAVDIYRPDYGVFENVFAMGQNRGANKDENVLSQMVCCFVGMGYQVQIFNQDAYSAGSGQQRSRLLLSIAAPGLVPIDRVPSTHSHPPNTSNRNVGTASNGVPFGKRTFGDTPFRHATAESTIGDLPDIQDALVNMCIPFPDHRVSSTKRTEGQMIIRNIPRFPYGCSYRSAVEMGYMPKDVQQKSKRDSKLWKSSNNRSFGRLYPNKLMPTVITHVTPSCAINGRALHYDQLRILTVMEARRAQSYPDHEVLIGTAADQWKIVGNSVDRKMAAAAGVALREAWLANDDYDGFIQSYVLTKQDMSIEDAVTASVAAETEEDELVVTEVPTLKRKRISDTDELDDDLIVVKRPYKLEKRRSSTRVVEPTKATIAAAPKQLLEVVSTAQRGTTDELGDAASHDDISIYDVPEELPQTAMFSASRPHPQSPRPRQMQPGTSIFALFAARKRSPTTGRLIPQQNTTKMQCTRPLLSSGIPQPQLPRPVLNGSRRVTSVVTTGFLSPPTSEEHSPARQLPSSAPSRFPIQQGLFRSISQRSSSPARDTDEDEDELSMHVDSALAITSTDHLGLEPGVSVKDVVEEHREHSHAARTGYGEPEDDDHVDWMNMS